MAKYFTMNRFYLILIYYFLKQVHFLKWICVILGYIYKENSLNSEYLYKAFTYYQTLKKRHLINNIRYNN